MQESGAFLQDNIPESRENKHSLWLLSCCWFSWPFSPGGWSGEQGMSPAGWLVWNSDSLFNLLHAKDKILTSLRLNMRICSVDGCFFLPHKVPIRTKCGNICKKLLAKGKSQEVFNNYLLFPFCHACFKLGPADPMYLHSVLPWLLSIIIYLYLLWC